MLIVIEGCVGAGKSTVAKGLAECRKSMLLLEDFESNPFLRAFYTDPVENALETEFSFLLLHFHQLKGHAEKASRSEVIADFHLGKDLLYADYNLKDPRATHAFNELYNVCVERTPQPALLIFLSASTGLLIDRIRGRQRDFEQDVDPQYYAGLNEAYEAFFHRFPGTKLSVRMDQMDFVKNPTLFEELSLLVDGKLHIK